MKNILINTSSSSSSYRITLPGLLIFLMVVVNGNAQSLKDYQQIAAENNPGLKSSYLMFEAAMQKITQVNVLPDPNLSFGYFISPVETRVGPQRARFSLTQLFPWFGSLRLQGEAASLLAEARYQEFLDYRNRLFYQVAAAYFPVEELHRLRAIEIENIRILTTYKEITTTKFQNAKGSMTDVLRADLMLKEANTNLTILDKKYKPLVTRLNTLLNRNAADSVIIQTALPIIPLEENYRKDSVLTANPLMEQLQKKINAAEVTEKAIERQGLPKLGLGVDYVIVDKRTDMAMTDNGKDILMPMLSVSLPVFRSKYKSAEKENRLVKESYVHQREELGNQLINSYDRVYSLIDQQLALLNLYEEQITESEQILNLLFSAYSNDQHNFEDVLQMQQQLLKYRKLKSTASKEYHVAVAEINYLTANIE